MLQSLYFDNFNDSSIVVDVGCGHEAEFSKHMIEKYELNAFGVDPTRKHAPFLRRLEEVSMGKFRYLPIAVTKGNGTITFHESSENESGSILTNHTNVLHDSISSYDVESISLSELAREVGKPIDFIKLDLEGAEYELLKDATEEDLKSFKQIFVEFHHHCTDYTKEETWAICDHICRQGFRPFTLEGHNYLFKSIEPL